MGYFCRCLPPAPSRSSLRTRALASSPQMTADDVFAHVKECPELDGCQPGDAVTFDTKYDDRKGKYNATNLSVSGGGGGGGGGGGKSKGKGGGKGYSAW